MKFSGTVQKGGEYGHKLGFPTANIMYDGKESGIFAAKVTVLGKTYSAAVYADQRNKVLEAHILDFKDDIYDMKIEIELLEKIRDDRQFESEDEAKKTIFSDVQRAREYHRMH